MKKKRKQQARRKPRAWADLIVPDAGGAAGPVLFVRSPHPPHVVGGTGGNYDAKILALHAAGAFAPGRAADLAIRHDDGCGVFDQKPCNCDPHLFLNGKRVA